MLTALGGASSETTATQTVQVTVVGGELELATDEATVALERTAGPEDEWTGTLPAVRVVDARGTHAGWTVRWTVSAVDIEGSQVRPHSHDVRLAPGDPVIVAGLADGLFAGRSARARPHGRPLFGAAPGTGGGTYEVGAQVAIRLPRSVDAESVVVALAFTLD